MDPRFRGDDRRRWLKAFEQVNPFRVVALDQLDFPIPVPVFQHLLPLNGTFNAVTRFEINQLCDIVFLCEARHRMRSVFVNASHKIVGHADVKRAVLSARENVDEMSHRLSIPNAHTTSSQKAHRAYLGSISPVFTI